MVNVRLTHIDGNLPNLALMQLAHWHREKGDRVHLSRNPNPTMFEPDYDVVYGSAIFGWSTPVVRRLQEAYPNAIVGGTGSGNGYTVEQVIGEASYENFDYSIYPDYRFSLGFTQRGCRLKCGFCVVPQKEGAPRSVNTIDNIYRHNGVKNICLLDNDFFGQPPDQWRARMTEIRDGGFKVCFNQGINIRLVSDEIAAELATIPYYDDQFYRRRLYTAWDNLGQETAFFQGLDRLKEAGIPTTHLMVYMLIGYDPSENIDRIMYRYRRLKEAGCLPYPMVYNNANKELKRFQRWVVRRYDDIVPWSEFGRSYTRAMW